MARKGFTGKYRVGRGWRTVEKEVRLARLSQVDTGHITTTVTKKSREIRGLRRQAKNRRRAFRLGAQAEAWATRADLGYAEDVEVVRFH